MNSKIGRKFYYLEKFNSWIGRKLYYSLKLYSNNFFAINQYNFISLLIWFWIFIRNNISLFKSQILQFLNHKLQELKCHLEIKLHIRISILPNEILNLGSSNLTAFNIIRWVNGTIVSLTKRLMFQVLFFFHNFLQNSLQKSFQFNFL